MLQCRYMTNVINQKINENIDQLLLTLLFYYKGCKEDFNVEINFNNFLTRQTHSKSKMFLLGFLNIFNPYCTDFESFRYLINSTYGKVKGKEFPAFVKSLNLSKDEIKDLSDVKPVFDEFKDFMSYMTYFVCSGYIKYDNQLEVVIPKLDLDAPLKSWSKIVDGKRIKSYDSLITEDGTIYLACWEHELLCYWLSLNNIPIKHAMRVYQNPVPPQIFSISSLAPYNYHEQDYKDQSMRLKEAQVKSFCAMFYKLSEGRELLNRQNLLDILLNHSENLGCGPYPFFDMPTFRYNAWTFEEVLGTEKFNTNEALDKFKETKQIREIQYKRFTSQSNKPQS